MIRLIGNLIAAVIGVGFLILILVGLEAAKPILPQWFVTYDHVIVWSTLAAGAIIMAVKFGR